MLQRVLWPQKATELENGGEKITKKGGKKDVEMMQSVNNKSEKWKQMWE